jgi:hypothetical protein
MNLGTCSISFSTAGSAESQNAKSWNDFANIPLLASWMDCLTIRGPIALLKLYHNTFHQLNRQLWRAP